jgi:hypothetical protein
METCFVASWSLGIRLHGNVFVNAFPGNQPACYNNTKLYNFGSITPDRVTYIKLLDILIIVK